MSSQSFETKSVKMVQYFLKLSIVLKNHVIRDPRATRTNSPFCGCLLVIKTASGDSANDLG